MLSESFNSITFQSLWAPLVLLPILLVPKMLMSRPKIASAATLSRARVSKVIFFRNIFIKLTAALAIAGLVFAALNPERLSQTPQPLLARDLMLVIDVSPSMGTPDYLLEGREITRLQAVQVVLAKFIEKRAGDRLGLVVFGGKTFVLSPLTFDYQVLQRFVSSLRVGIAGDGTAIGDGLGTALKRLQDLPGTSKAVILVTDGVNNVGLISPTAAGNVAAQLKIKVHTIGIGSERSEAFAKSNGKVEYDEETLKNIAKTSSGEFFNAQDIEGLSKIYAAIDRLEREEHREPNLIHGEFLAWWGVLLAMIALSLQLLVARIILPKVP